MSHDYQLLQDIPQDQGLAAPILQSEKALVFDIDGPCLDLCSPGAKHSR